MRVAVAAIVRAFIGLVAVSIFSGAGVRAAVIYESATYVQTGEGGLPINCDQTALGSRFHLDQPVEVTSVGGHLGADRANEGTFFAAIASIGGPDAYPSGTPVDLSELAAFTLFVPAYPSSDFRIALSAVLEPGYYAVIFGTNSLGAADGLGYMPIEQQTILPGNLGGMFWAVDNNQWGPFELPARFVVEGTVVPEPCTCVLLSFGGLLLAIRRTR
jgi:hypothetical protein